MEVQFQVRHDMTEHCQKLRESNFGRVQTLVSYTYGIFSGLSLPKRARGV